MAVQAGRTRVVPTLAPADDEVVARVLEGDVALFEVLMRRHNPRLYRAIRSVLRDEAEVEDAMQQAYLQAYAHLGDFQGQAAFSTWLVRIGVNEALMRLRGRGRLVLAAEPPEGGRVGEEEHVADPSPEDQAATHEARALLEQAVDRLPLHLRTVYVLREIEQLSTAEVAAALELGEEAVKVRLHRARLALRELIAARVGQSAPKAFGFLAPRCDRVVAAVLAAIPARR
ncbi:RNA polymerase, sigma-24 subunit, ECF subfamily [Anaeromyxobacter dehalogenans 2CP-1]|uniref:RNA polymerase, sigma-24 subunit, ECF subfamily n=1 Tax=Anaeromyxobacter dehalogenans (strain ATCC BAA-258 / DSM 21875 / 2CP-1) TaxID=455488 RepID=B8JB40_ANAD2|nr:RNA polymerase sigma factor [Anaeromyxobacter dehalogenans]ACL63851.1 RNA polymerase, sigma-24 subunit, ECF subfamily [Anaeromyxobacter dehalogenans 2CP-1]